jgi:hypothetical protein
LADQSPEKIVNDFFDHPNLRHVRERSALAVLSCNGAIAGLFPISESASVALAEAQDGEHLIEALAIAVTVQTPVRAALLEYLASELPRQ